MTAPQTQPIGWANAQTNSANNLLNWYANQVALNNQFTNNGIATLLSNCTTAPIGADGTQSGTTDGTPNTAHPLSAAVYPTLQRTLSEIQLAQIQTACQAVTNYIDGLAVTTNPGAHAILNNAVLGQ
jgi:hypothetical protein